MDMKQIEKIWNDVRENWLEMNSKINDNKQDYPPPKKD